MKCPYCGTYNPEERTTCWRCDKELPTPKPVKKKNPQKSAQTLLYVLMAAFAAFTILLMCGTGMSSGTEAPTGQGPSGHLTLPAPVAYIGTVPWGA